MESMTHCPLCSSTAVTPSVTPTLSRKQRLYRRSCGKARILGQGLVETLEHLVIVLM